MKSVLLFLAVSSGLHAQEIARPVEAELIRVATEKPGVKPTEPCLNLVETIATGFGFGTIDRERNAIKGAFVSRFRVSKKSGAPLVAAVKNDGDGPLSTIYPAIKGEEPMPELRARRGGARFRTLYDGIHFQVRIENAPRGQAVQITAEVDPAKHGEPMKCRVKSVTAQVKVRDTDAERQNEEMLRAQGIENPESEEVFRTETHTLKASDCQKTITPTTDVREISKDPEQTLTSACQLLRNYF